MTALGHGPSMTGLAIERHVDAHMVLGLNGRPQAFEGARVVGRKDAADEGNDRQRVTAVIADGIDVPPAITTRRDGLVESR
jgi:hypothetical protein